LCVIRKAFSSEGIFENDLLKLFINFTNELAIASRKRRKRFNLLPDKAYFHEYVETVATLTIFGINNILLFYFCLHDFLSESSTISH